MKLLFLIPKGENGLPLHPSANIHECMKSFEKVVVDIPSDDDIKQEADCYHGLESYNTTFVQGAKWMRDKIKGGEQ